MENYKEDGHHVWSEIKLKSMVPIIFILK